MISFCAFSARHLPLRIGLLGGSFNPAHAGHLHVSLQAMKHLRLQRIWWIISPQNPLKSKQDIADYDLRVRVAKELVKQHPAIQIVEVERKLGLHYTVDTLSALKIRFPATKFIWLMGADNLMQLHRWRQWRKIFRLVPVAVYNRDDFSYKALRSRAALAYGSKRRDPTVFPFRSPFWCYLFLPRHPESGSRLRNLLGKDAFLVHNEVGSVPKFF